MYTMIVYNFMSYYVSNRINNERASDPTINKAYQIDINADKLTKKEMMH